MVRPEQQLAVVEEMRQYARELFAESEMPGVVVDLSGNPDADRFVLDNPNAFFVAVLFDRQIQAERAWAAPILIRDRLGHFDMRLISEMNSDDMAVIIQGPPALHRYVATMAHHLVLAAGKLVREYDGNAANIWNDRPRVGDVIRRFQSFVGIGPKIAAMAADILVRELGVPMLMPSGSEIAVDIHIRRVFLRAGMVERDDPMAIQAAARRLCPDDPSVLDRPAWFVGRKWCRPTPMCSECRLTDVCPKLDFAIAG